MIRSAIVLATLLVVPLATPVFAQTAPVHAEAARMLAQACLTAPRMAGQPNANAMCQCLGEITVRNGDERLLTLFTRVFAHYPDQDAARAELQSMIDNEGYTRADYVAVGEMLNQAVDTVGEQCGDATDPAPDVEAGEQ